MLKYKHALVVLSAVILTAATFTDKPVNAQTKLDQNNCQFAIRNSQLKCTII